MPNRIIKESIFTSPNFNKLSLQAQSHFYRILLLADDHGCLELSTSVVRGRCYPLLIDKVSNGDIDSWHNELDILDIIRVWEEKDRVYGYFPTFSSHQRVRSLHTRKTPEPPSAVTCRQLTSDDRLNLNLNPVLNLNHNLTEELQKLKLYKSDEKLIAKLPEQIKAWQIAYPDTDIIAVIRKAHAWELANPTKRKSDRIRFLNNWLSREGNGSNEPDKPRGIPANLKSPTAVGFTDKQRNIIVQLECWRGDYLCKARDDKPPGVDLNIDWTDIADDIKIEDFIKLPGQQNYKEVVK